MAESKAHAPGHEMSGEGVRMQHANAQGRGPTGDFGIKSFAEANHAGKEHPDANMGHEAMGDGERAGPPAIRNGGGKMASSAHSDHGPHHVSHGPMGQHYGHAGPHRGGRG